ncbi:MAG: hypothetical protein JWM32_560 [Verrucomicrobia bacterium]|nr:hypothetical protein [Verrucomicrobiota bacterium]
MPPSTAIPSLLSRAQRLGSGALLALVPFVAPVKATIMTIDYSASTNVSNSGWFTGTRDDSKADGIIINNGFKLWGGDTRSDSMFWRYNPFTQQTEPGYDTTGLAFVWGGTIKGATSYQDKLTAPFDFTVTFTDNDGGRTSVSSNLIIGYRTTPYSPYPDNNSNPTVPTSGAYNYTNSYHSYNEAGTYHETGNLNVGLSQTDAETDLYWFALLTIDWSSEFVSAANWRGSYQTLSGDTLSVTIPQNSIDVTYSEYVPEPPPSSTVPEAGSTLALLALALAGMVGLRRWR